MNKKIILAILALTLANLACGFTVDLGQGKVGPDVTDSIKVSPPDDDEANVEFSFGAGEFHLAGGAKQLVEGTVIYNVEDFKPEVIENGSNIEIKQGDLDQIPPLEDLKNEWDLKLGKLPIALDISAGAYEGVFELGGLSLTSLNISDGASDVELSFSEPNLVEMSQFRYSTGASEVRLNNLANANFETFVFNGGAGDYTFDFSGDLQRDATVSIDSGLADITLIIPEGINAVVTIDSAVADINVGSGWSHKSGTYTQEGEGPTLTIVINIAAGEVTITD